MTIDGRAFWTRVDTLLAARGVTLLELCRTIGTSYYTVNTQRKKSAVPKTEQLFSMAEFFAVDAEELVLGRKPESALPPEARAVIEDDALRTLVRYCLSAIELIIERARADSPKAALS